VGVGFHFLLFPAIEPYPQTSFSELAWNSTSGSRAGSALCKEMDAVIPWARLIALIAPHYPKARRGQRFLGLEKMPRICFLQLLVRPLGRGGGKRRV
jgi:hypothetical protein